MKRFLSTVFRNIKWLQMLWIQLSKYGYSNQKVEYVVGLRGFFSLSQMHKHTWLQHF